MKKLFSLFMVALVLAASCCFVFARPVSAAEEDYTSFDGFIDDGWYVMNTTLYDPSIVSFDFSEPSIVIVACGFPGVMYSGISDFMMSVGDYDSSIDPAEFLLTSPLFYAYGTLDTDTEGFGFVIDVQTFLPASEANQPGMYDLASSIVVYLTSVEVSYENLPGFLTPVDFDSVLGGSGAASPSPDPVTGSGIYGSIANIIQNTFYGDTEISGWQEMVIVVLATAACALMFALPFLIVIFIIRSIGSWR